MKNIYDFMADVLAENSDLSRIKSVSSEVIQRIENDMMIGKTTSLYNLYKSGVLTEYEMVLIFARYNKDIMLAKKEEREALINGKYRFGNIKANNDMLIAVGDGILERLSMSSISEFRNFALVSPCASLRVVKNLLNDEDKGIREFAVSKYCTVLDSALEMVRIKVNHCVRTRKQVIVAEEYFGDNDFFDDREDELYLTLSSISEEEEKICLVSKPSLSECCKESTLDLILHDLIQEGNSSVNTAIKYNPNLQTGAVRKLLNN